MPKTGVITASSGSDDNIKALGNTQPVTATLPGIQKLAFAASAANKKGLIELASGGCTIVPAATNIAAVTGATGLELACTITHDDATKATSTVTVVDGGDADGLGAAMDAEFTTPVQPTFSVEAVIGRVEDLVAAQGGVFAGKSALIVTNQADNSIKVYVGTEANIIASNPPGALTEDAYFVRSLTSATRQYGE